MNENFRMINLLADKPLRFPSFCHSHEYENYEKKSFRNSFVLIKILITQLANQLRDNG